MVYHDEAIRCFEQALSEDPGMVMALWGIAYAWGPNINNMLIAPHQIAQAALAIRRWGERLAATPRGAFIKRAAL